jgi:hypothetical protein
MNSLPFDILFEIYKYLNLKEKIMMSKNFKFFKYLLKQNILNKIINVGLAESSIGFRKDIRIIYSSYNVKSIIYPFFVNEETLNKINNCIYLEEQNNLIKSILLNGIQFNDVFYSIEQNFCLAPNSYNIIKKSADVYVSKFYFHEHDSRLSQIYDICQKFYINDTRKEFYVTDNDRYNEIDSDDNDSLPELI